MKFASLIALATILILAFSATIQAQSFEKLSRVELRLGMWKHSSDDRSAVSDEGSTLTVEGSGIKGGAAYNYYFKENMAITFSVDLFFASVEAVQMNDIYSATSIIAPVLLGVKYYLPKSTYGKALRPYVTAAAGTFVGRQNRKEVDSDIIVSSKVSMAYGGHLGIGVDLRLGQLFALNLSGGYYLMTKFSDRIGGSENFSGPEFGAGFSFLFGQKSE